MRKYIFIKIINLILVTLMSVLVLFTGCGEARETSKAETLEDKIMEYAEDEVWIDATSSLFARVDLVGTANVNCSSVNKREDGTYSVSGKVSWTEYPEDKHRKSFAAFISVGENGEMTCIEINYH